MKFKTLTLLAALFAGAMAQAAEPLFTEDFEWLEPWSSLTPAGQTVETSDPDATAQQLGTNKVDGVSTYDALLAKGYSFPICCKPDISPRKPQAQTYLQRNYLKFGLTGYYSGFSFPIDGTKADANTDYNLSFKWCPMGTTTGNFDATQLVVIMECPSGNKTFSVPQHTLQNGQPYEWIPVNIYLGKITDANTRITVRNADEQWPDASGKAYRWFIDDISVAGEDPVLIEPKISFDSETLDIPLGEDAELGMTLTIPNNLEIVSERWTVKDETVAEYTRSISNAEGITCAIFHGKNLGKTEANYDVILSNGVELNAAITINVNFATGLTFDVDNIKYIVTSGNTVDIKDGTKFRGGLTLNNTVIYNGVTYAVSKILERAFINNFHLTAVELGEGIEIEKYAFSSCIKLAKVTLPSGLKAIEEYTFNGCRELVEINFPVALEKIGRYAFDHSALSTVELPESLTTIEEYAFIRNDQLEYLSIGKNVSSIGTGAFYDCPAIKEIKLALENQWYALENGMLLSADKKTLKLYPCGREESILNIPEYIKYFETFVFKNAKFQTLIFPEGMKEIPFVCVECPNLEIIKLPSTVKRMGSNTFNGCHNIKTIYIEARVAPKLELKYPTFESHTLGETELKTWYTVYVPEGCVDAYASSEWGELTKYIFDDENHVTRFTVDNLSFMVMDNNTLAITDGTQCEGDVEICSTINYKDTNYTVNAIMARAFSNSSLKSINLPASIDFIDYEAFKSCERLEKANLPSGLKSIEYGTFDSCTKLSDITLPSILEKIGEAAFTNCDFTSLTLPESLTSIGDDAFNSCKSLTSLCIGKNVSSIGKSILSRCLSLNDISVDPDNKWYVVENGMLLTADKSTLTAYALDNGVTTFEIPPYINSFDDNALTLAKFDTVIFLEGRTTIPQIFSAIPAVETVKLPSTTTEFSELASFWVNVKKIYCFATIPPVFHKGYVASHFNSYQTAGYEAGTLIVPKGCVDAYKASPWGELTDNIIEYDPSGVENVVVESADAEPVIYDLYGRRVANPAPGHIYIINGKKVLVK